MKAQKSFETPKACLSCSIRLGNHFVPYRIFFAKCRIMPNKCKRGDPLRFINIHSVAKYQKCEGGPFGDIGKISKKVSQRRKKLKGDQNLLVSSGFVGYVEKVKKKKGATLCSKFPLAGLALSSFSSSCKKWTDQC